MGQLVIMVAGVLGLAAMVSAGPKAVVKEATWDLGKVPSFGHVAHTFTLMNQGDAPLEVDSILPECGCTTTDRKGGRVPPGGTWRFQLAFNAGILPQGGERTEKARVYTNDPGANPLWVSLVTQVIPGEWETVDVMPRVMEIDSPKRGSLGILVTNKTKAPIQFSLVEASGFIARAWPGSKTLGPGASARIRLRVQLPAGVDTRSPVARLAGMPVHSSLTFSAVGPEKSERLTVPGELGRTIRERNVNVELR